MENTFACVIWKDFKNLYGENSDSEFIAEAWETGKSWFTVLDEDLSINNFFFISDLTDKYLAGIEEFDQNTKDAIEGVLGLLSVDVGDAIWDLPRHEDEEWLFSVLSPNSVNMAFEKARAFEDIIPTLSRDSDFRENLSTYIEELQKILNTCTSTNSGLIILTA